MTNDQVEPGYTWQGWAGFDDTPDTPDYRYYLAEVSDRLPGADPSTVATLALHLARAASEPWDTSSDNGTLANARADVGDAAGLTRWAMLADMTPGSHDALRALHAWVKVDQDGAPDQSSAPDPYTGQVHQVTRKRARSGRTSTIVTRRGVAQVQGSWRPWWTTSVPLSSDHRRTVEWYEHYQSTRSPVRRMRYGSNAIDVTRAARMFDVERLVGTDVKVYAQPPLDTTERVHWMGRYQDIGGYATTHDLRRAATEHNWSDQDSDGLDWDDRYTLPAVKPRKSEPVDHVHLIGPYVTADQVWIGHRLVDRGPTARKRTGKVTRTVDGIKTDQVDRLADRLANLAPGQRVTLTFGPWQGSITCTPKSRWSGRLTSADGTTWKTDGQRSLPALVAALPPV